MSVNVSIIRSPRKGKAFRAVFVRLRDAQKTHTDFGSSLHNNFTEHHDEERKRRFLTRFRSLIEQHKDNPQAPITLSTWLLWNRPTLEKSFNDYVKHFHLRGKIDLIT